jgi:hypothetical protein
MYALVKVAHFRTFPIVELRLYAYVHNAWRVSANVLELPIGFLWVKKQQPPYTSISQPMTPQAETIPLGHATIT